MRAANFTGLPAGHAQGMLRCTAALQMLTKHHTEHVSTEYPISIGTPSRLKSPKKTATRARTLHGGLRGRRWALVRVRGVGFCVRGHACKGHAQPHARRRRRHMGLQRPGLVCLLRAHALCCRSLRACALRTAASSTRIQTLFLLFQGPGCCRSLRSLCSGHLDMFISQLFCCSRACFRQAQLVNSTGA